MKNKPSITTLPDIAVSAINGFYRPLIAFKFPSITAEDRAPIEELEKAFSDIGAKALPHAPTNRGQTAFVAAGAVRGFRSFDEIETAALMESTPLQTSERIDQIARNEMTAISIRAAELAIVFLEREFAKLRAQIAAIDLAALEAIGLVPAGEIVWKINRLVPEMSAELDRANSVVNRSRLGILNPASFLALFNESRGPEYFFPAHVIAMFSPAVDAPSQAGQ